MRYALNSDFDMADVLDKIKTIGGVSFPFLAERDRQELLAVALTYEYERQPEIVGKAEVRQDFSSLIGLPDGSPFRDLWRDCEALLKSKLAAVPGSRACFSAPLGFTEPSIQRYEPGSFGISPHRDSTWNINLVVSIVLTGRSRFGLCRDRERQNVIALLDDSPGNIILLRAHGFQAEMEFPFHFLTDIPELRISFGLRQVVPIL